MKQRHTHAEDIRTAVVPAHTPLRQAATYLSLLLLGAGVTLGGTTLLKQWQQSGQLPILPAVAAQPDSAPASQPALLTTPNVVSKVVEQAGAAVVRIDASRTVTRKVPDAFNDPFLRRFFGSQVPIPPSEQIQRGLGSGFILNTDGHVVTNAHVVDGADTVKVTLRDGRALDGKVMGTDKVTDVAVIKIEADDLPTVPLSNSEQIKPGQWAIAIGNPLGLDNTVTVGIISATGRSSGEVGIPDQRVSFIQTDTAINPGNSGGPLLNLNGEVIGVNTAIIRGAQGIGFAIPINTAQQIAGQLIATGKVDHSYLGVQMVTLTPEVKQNLNQDPNSGLTVQTDQGILIANVLPNSPAAQAGLRAGDVIHQVNGNTVTDSAEVQALVAQQSVGSELQLKIQRQGKSRTVVAQLASIPRQG